MDAVFQDNRHATPYFSVRLGQGVLQYGISHFCDVIGIFLAYCGEWSEPIQPALQAPPSLTQCRREARIP